MYVSYCGTFCCIIWAHFQSSKSFVGIIHIKRIMLTIKISNVQSLFTKGLSSFNLSLNKQQRLSSPPNDEDGIKENIHYLYYNDISFGAAELTQQHCICRAFKFDSQHPHEVSVNPGPGVMHFFAFLGNRHVNVIKVDIYIHIHTCICMCIYVCVCDRRETPYFKKLYLCMCFFLIAFVQCIIGTLFWLKLCENFEYLSLYFKETGQGYCDVSFCKTQNCSLKVFSCSLQYSSQE